MKLLIVLSIAAVVESFCPQPARKQVRLLDHVAPLQQRLKADKEWIEKDMKEAGHAEHESEDWVADDMERLGSQGGENIFDRVGWVSKDMFRTGQAATHVPHKKEADGTVKDNKNYDIAKDMKRTGKSTDWIARDMETAGHPSEESRSKFSTEHWFNEQEKHRKDVQEGMEKAGQRGSDRDSQVRADMEATGQAHNPFEALEDFFHSVTFKMSEWTEKAFNEKEIIKDMETAGKSSDQTWLKRDMEMAGKEGTDHGQRLPKQKQELEDDLSNAKHEEYIAKDIEREGMSGGNVRSARTQHNRYDLVSVDMKLTGTRSEDRIRQDMENAGHAAEGRVVAGVNNRDTQYQREVQQFKSMPHARPKAPVEPKSQHLKVPKKETEVVVAVAEEGKEVQDVPDKEKDKHKEGFVRHVFKKVRHPRTPWKEL